MGDIVTLPVVTRLALEPDRLLREAIGDDLEGVVIIGRRRDGRRYFASSISDGGDVVWLMERAKLQLFVAEDELEATT
jgi:hypothetical protein